MAKRERAWTPDVYDMAARQPEPDDDEELGALGRRGKRTPIARLTGRFRRTDRVSPAPETDPAHEMDIVDLAAAQEPDIDPDIVDGPVTRSAPVRTMPSQSDNSALLGLVMGALVGAGLTLLATPASGRQVRERLQVSSRTVAQKMPYLDVLGTEPPAAGEQER